MPDINRRHILAAAALAPFAGSLPALAQSGGAGVVLLHGKRGSPGGGGIGTLGRALSSAGFLTAHPEMPWSSSRYLSGTWSDAMAEIAGHVAAMRAQGAKKVLLAGQSMGCPAAMSYAATRGGLAGLILAAPGHNPFGLYINDPKMKESIDRAVAMVKSGKGGESATFYDSNQGSALSVTMPAAAYLSFMSPKGPCAMQNTYARVRVPTIWVVGTDDAISRYGVQMGRTITRGPKGKYLEVSANHGSTASVAASEIVEWAKTV